VYWSVPAPMTSFIGKTPVRNLFVNCGWGTGGFKATPGSGHVFAYTVNCGNSSQIASSVWVVMWRPPCWL
jgi:glycine/D-amino acid oxidase-like deaminating enzyme